MKNQAKWYENYRVVQLSKETHAKLKEHCKDTGMKMGGLIEKLVLADIESVKKSREWDEQYRTKRLMEEMFGLQIPSVDKVTDYETIIEEGSNKSK
jgi:hypothetical protein